MVIHTVAAGSGILVIRKYEKYLQQLNYFSMFNPNNFCAQRLWFVLLSVLVSFGYFIFAAELFVKVNNALIGWHILKYVVMNMTVGILILQYNYFMLKDRRQ
jgi:hypothetical protein